MALENRLIAITGASAGIGQAVASKLLELGASIVINARRGEKLETFRKSLPSPLRSKVAIVVGDAAQQSTIDQLFSEALKTFGEPLNGVVVNAGRGLKGSVTSADLDQIKEVVDTNIHGALLLMRRAALEFQKMRSDGLKEEKPLDIIVLGSTVGRQISPFSAVYGATKFAVHALAEALRREVAAQFIRVTTIAPGIVLSEFQSVAGYQQDWFEKFASKWDPLLEPGDIANAITYVLQQPSRVSVGEIVIRPTRQDYP